MQQATVDTVTRHAAHKSVSWLGDRRPLQIAKALLIGHLAALVFGLAGMLIAIPNPDLWADSEVGLRVYDFGMRYAGSLHIIFGATAMFFWGIAAIGIRRTAIFFAAAVPISLTSELLGTSTGEPFGNYAYTNFLGYKVLDHVPFSIPLSWFYVGFATYMIGHVLAAQWNLRPRAIYAVIFGAWLLTVWDLVLDPAMAHESLSVKFWAWDETGPYFGMPTQNFIGWTLTAVVFMTVARLLWRADPSGGGHRLAIWFPVAVFAANIVFASVLSASVDLWVPILLAVMLGLLPSLFALRGSRGAA
ncbi:MAG TPA: carotenoid biosynthesis protein [Thermomicrobiales bacterium]|nr:carotenoid biosynthesis protein [Thermomicrobiales bacterium]